MEFFAEHGSVMALSDAACGAELAKAALRTAWLNVLVNTKLMDDADAASRIESEACALAAEYSERADAVFTRIRLSFAREGEGR
jgi:formiminotetrahydrofolate cyclodeaminase